MVWWTMVNGRLMLERMDGKDGIADLQVGSKRKLDAKKRGQGCAGWSNACVGKLKFPVGEASVQSLSLFLDSGIGVAWLFFWLIFYTLRLRFILQERERWRAYYGKSMDFNIWDSKGSRMSRSQAFRVRNLLFLLAYVHDVCGDNESGLISGLGCGCVWLVPCEPRLGLWTKSPTVRIHCTKDASRAKLAETKARNE